MKNQVIQGDCLIEMQKIPDKSVALILQDPPYFLTACKWDIDIMDRIDEYWAEWKRIIKDNGAIVMTASQPFTSKLVMSNIKMFKYCWYWKKSKPNGWLHSKNRPMTAIEEVCVFSKAPTGHLSELGGRRMLYSPQDIVSIGIKKVKASKREALMGARPNQIGREYEAFTGFPHNVLEYPNVIGKQALHPTQKPVSLFEYLIKTYTSVGDVVFDGFAGSFTTAIAAENLNRNWICIEQNEAYCEIGRNRIKENEL